MTKVNQDFGSRRARSDSKALRVTCVDTARVLPVARDLVGRMGVLGQVDFVTAGLLTADLGGTGI